MIRSEFCAVCEVAVPTFNTHRRNGDVPFDLFQVEARDGQGRHWSRFGAHEAAFWIAAQHLAAQGVTWSEAARIMRTRDQTRCSHGGPGHHPIEAPGHFVARAEFRRIDNTGSGLVPAHAVYRGQLTDIAATVARRVEAFNARQPDEAERIVATSLISTNLSHAYNTAIARMEALGLDEPDFKGAPDDAE